MKSGILLIFPRPVSVLFALALSVLPLVAQHGSRTWTSAVDNDFNMCRKTYAFSQTTGNLVVIPEPNAFALLASLLCFCWVVLRRPKQ